MSVEQLIKRLAELAQDDETPQDPLLQAGRASTLLERYDAMSVKHTFEPRQLVQWKPELCNRKTSGVMVVVKVLDAPVFDDETDSGTPLFREPLDIVVGEFTPNSDYCEFHLDSRRLEPYTGPLATDL